MDRYQTPLSACDAAAARRRGRLARRAAARAGAGMIEFVGSAKVEHDLEGIAGRLADPNAVMRRQAAVLEASEAGTFAELGGRYVATGTTLRSLTLPDAPHAVRRASSGRRVGFGMGRALCAPPRPSASGPPDRVGRHGADQEPSPCSSSPSARRVRRSPGGRARSRARRQERHGRARDHVDDRGHAAWPSPGSSPRLSGIAGLRVRSSSASDVEPDCLDARPERSRRWMPDVSAAGPRRARDLSFDAALPRRAPTFEGMSSSIASCPRSSGA